MAVKRRSGVAKWAPWLQPRSVRGGFEHWVVMARGLSKLDGAVTRAVTRAVTQVVTHPGS